VFAFFAGMIVLRHNGSSEKSVRLLYLYPVFNIPASVGWSNPAFSPA